MPVFKDYFINIIVDMLNGAKMLHGGCVAYLIDK